MLSHSKIKFIKSLAIKKHRETTGLFVVEGVKMVDELIKSTLQIHSVYYTSSFRDHLHNTSKTFDSDMITDDELQRISHQKTPNKVIALAYIPKKFSASNKGLKMALDNIQDPGNLGTIVRTAAWFGIKKIYCSPGSADIYNPKALQSTMGAIFNTDIEYVSLDKILSDFQKKHIPVYAASLDGHNLYTAELHENAVILLGNESKGISSELMPLVTKKIVIPFYGNSIIHTESLNVSMAASIICAEFRRRQYVGQPYNP